eukprot:2327582-Pleurochrysis_carterae.AAC.1
MVDTGLLQRGAKGCCSCAAAAAPSVNANLQICKCECKRACECEYICVNARGPHTPVLVRRPDLCPSFCVCADAGRCDCVPAPVVAPLE